MPNIFTVERNITKRKYIIDGFLASKTMNNIISQAGVGKTRLAFQMAVDVATGNDFLGMKVKQSKVLIVDNDQSEDESNEMLTLCLNYYGLKSCDNLLTSFQEDSYGIKNDSLINLINSTDAELILLDSLTAFAHGLDMSKARDMQGIKKLYTECIGKGKTIVWLHHISEHKQGDFMVCDPSDLCLYSSVINGTMDGYFILHNPNKGIDIKKLVIRPVVKRYKISSGTIETSQVETKDNYHFDSAVSIEQSEIVSEDEQDIMLVFVESQKPRSVNQVYGDLEGKHGICKVRELLHKLEKQGKIRVIKHKSNLFKYELIKEKEGN